MSEKTIHDLMVTDAGAGFTDLSAQDFSAPFLVIIQANSPYLNEQHQLYVEEARPGRIINTQSMKIHKDVHVIPCRYAFRNVEWKPRSVGGGFVQSYDRNSTPKDLINDPLTGFVSRSNGNLLQPTAYYLCLLVEENYEKIIIPMYSTQLKKSRRWNSMMISYKINENIVPMFGNSYHLSVVSESNSKGSWYGWKIDYNDEIMDTHIYQLAKTISQIQDFLPERLLVSLVHENNEETL